MYITKEKFEEIREKYSSLLIVESDIVDALMFVQDLLEAEADAIKAVEPYATAGIDRLKAAAYEVFDIQSGVENEEFLEEKEVSLEDKLSEAQGRAADGDFVGKEPDIELVQ